MNFKIDQHEWVWAWMPLYFRDEDDPGLRGEAKRMEPPVMSCSSEERVVIDRDDLLIIADARAFHFYTKEVPNEPVSHP